MDLRQLKRIKNIQKFNTGKIGFQPIKPDASFDPIGTNYSLLDQKVGLSNIPPITYTNDLNNITKQAQQIGGKIVSSSNNILGNTGTRLAGNIVQSAIPLVNTINSTINLGRKSTNQILAESGQSQGSIMGQSYTIQNVDEDAQMDQLKQESITNTLGAMGTGATIGAAFGPVGAGVGAAVGAIGGLFGGGAAKRRMKRRIREAQQRAFRMNAFNRASAMSDALDQQYNLDYSNTQDDILYANRGKDLKPLKRKKRC